MIDQVYFKSSLYVVYLSSSLGTCPVCVVLGLLSHKPNLTAYEKAVIGARMKEHITLESYVLIN